jgi:hypothetical protein
MADKMAAKTMDEAMAMGMPKDSKPWVEGCVVSWCAKCDGVLQPTVRHPRGRVRWQCWQCYPPAEWQVRVGEGRYVYSPPRVEARDEFVPWAVWRAWFAAQSEQATAMLGTRQVVPYYRGDLGLT